ncbi:MAG: hypothetical protein GF401_05240, partial [Chitinivibrionales bacterium]|nr:hypothetical protein [Chitinivibrionales bacterium]
MRLILGILSAAAVLYAQSSSSIEFFDSTGAGKTATFGWKGTAQDGKFFLENSSGTEEMSVRDGNVTATQFTGDGSGLSNVPIEDGSVTTSKIADRAVTDAKIDSLSWDKIKNKPVIPSGGIADGAVTSSKIANDAVTTAKISDRSVTEAKIDSVDWHRIKNMPDGFSDGVDNESSGGTTSGITGVGAGPGLTGGGASGNVELSVDFAGTGTLNTVSRSDHTHSDA